MGAAPGLGAPAASPLCRISALAFASPDADAAGIPGVRSDVLFERVPPRPILPKNREMPPPRDRSPTARGVLETGCRETSAAVPVPAPGPDVDTLPAVSPVLPLRAPPSVRIGSATREATLLSSAEGLLPRRSAEGRVMSCGVAGAFDTGARAGEETGLFAASPTVSREVMGLP